MSNDLIHDFAEKLVNGHWANVMDIVKYLNDHGVGPKIDTDKNIGSKQQVINNIRKNTDKTK